MLKLVYNPILICPDVIKAILFCFNRTILRKDTFIGTVKIKILKINASAGAVYYLKKVYCMVKVSVKFNAVIMAL